MTSRTAQRGDKVAAGMLSGCDRDDTGQDRIRLDKWLWFARFCKSRSLAARLCESGSLRIAGTPVTKAHHTIRPGDVLTFPLGRHIRVIEVLDLGERRGPAPEAQALYRDLAPPSVESALPRHLPA